MVLYTVFYGCFLYSLNMKKKYIKFKAFNSSHSGKPNIFYFRGAKFKPCLHPFVCTQMSFGLRLIFIFKSVCVMFVDPRIFTLSSTGHATSRRITTSTPPNPTSSCMCQEGKEWCGGAKGCQPLLYPFLRLVGAIFVPQFWARPFLPPEPSSPSNPPYLALAPSFPIGCSRSPERCRRSDRSSFTHRMCPLIGLLATPPRAHRLQLGVVNHSCQSSIRRG